MQLVFLFILYVDAADYIITEGIGSTEIQCPTLLCSLCDASEAYEINSMSFYIPGYLYSTSTILQEKAQELNSDLNGAISVAIGERWMCIEITNMTDIDVFPDLYNQLFGLNLDDPYNEIECFAVGDISTIVGIVERSGTGADWVQIQVASYNIQSQLNGFQVTEVREVVDREQQQVLYIGNVNLASEGTFEIDVPYIRKKKEDFKVSIINKPELIKNIQENFDCEIIESPSGITNINSFSPQDSIYYYIYNLKSFNLTNAEFSIIIPNFSFGYGAFLNTSTSTLRIDNVKSI